MCIPASYYPSSLGLLGFFFFLKFVAAIFQVVELLEERLSLAGLMWSGPKGSIRPP